MFGPYKPGLFPKRYKAKALGNRTLGNWTLGNEIRSIGQTLAIFQIQFWEKISVYLQTVNYFHESCQIAELTATFDVANCRFVSSWRARVQITLRG